MNDPHVESLRWLAQAKNDLAFAGIGIREGFFAQACFLAQQAAEKALKAVLYSGGARVVIGHSSRKLVQEIAPVFSDVERFKSHAALLDQYYIPTRYPNGIPEGSPFETYTGEQAAQAVSYTSEIIEWVSTIVDQGNPEDNFAQFK
jgi:HEPN domain-containing protein